MWYFHPNIFFFFSEFEKHTIDYLTWYFAHDLFSNLLDDLCYSRIFSIYIILNPSWGHKNTSDNALKIVHQFFLQLQLLINFSRVQFCATP